MTGKVINLRRERKRRARDTRAAEAEVASIQHGTSTSARNEAQRRSDKAAHELDGKKRE